FVDGDPLERDTHLTDVPVLGGPMELGAIVVRESVDRVIVAFSHERSGDLVELVESLKGQDVQVDIVPRLFETIGPSAIVHAVQGLPLIGLVPITPSRRKLMVKRTIDFAAAVAGLVVLSPFLLAVAVWIRLDSRGPIFYRHTRVGRGGKLFQVFKFRTMQLVHCQGDRYGGKSAEESFQELLRDPHRRSEFEESLKLAGDPRV